MVYLLKFGASWILPPGIFIILLTILTIYLTRINGKVAALVGAGTLIFYLMCTGFVAEKFMGSLEKAYSAPERLDESGVDVIVLLGGGAITDVQDVDGAGTLSASPANRLLTAVRLQKILDVPILLSGGQGVDKDTSEAVISSRVLRSLGVPEEKILLETESVNTTQNAVYSAEILREKKFKRPLIVTSAFHMRRAVLNFSRQGIEVIPYPTDFTVSHRPKFHYTKLRPQASALLLNVTVLQEVLRTAVTEIFNI